MKNGNMWIFRGTSRVVHNLKRNVEFFMLSNFSEKLVQKLPGGLRQNLVDYLAFVRHKIQQVKLSKIPNFRFSPDRPSAFFFFFCGVRNPHIPQVVKAPYVSTFKTRQLTFSEYNIFCMDDKRLGTTNEEKPLEVQINSNLTWVYK